MEMDFYAAAKKGVGQQTTGSDICTHVHTYTLTRTHILNPTECGPHKSVENAQLVPPPQPGGRHPI